MKYDITLIGNYTKDTVVTPAETKYVDGGGFNYGAHAAVALGAKTAAITRLKNNDQHVVENLSKIGGPPTVYNFKVDRRKSYTKLREIFRYDAYRAQPRVLRH